MRLLQFEKFWPRAGPQTCSIKGQIGNSLDFAGLSELLNPATGAQKQPQTIYKGISMAVS